MVRTTHAETKHLEYLQSLAKSHSCIVGLIIGQHFEGNDYILHLAQTPITSNDETENKNTGIKDIQESPIVEHGKHTTRMLSGGLHVLGIFVISDEHVVGPVPEKIGSIVVRLHKRLQKNQMMYGNCTGVEEKIILHYSKKDHTHKAVALNVHNLDEDKIKFDFEEKEQLWLPIKCRFELNELVSINSDDVELPLKKYMKEMMSWVDSSLKSAVYLFNGEMKKGTALIDAHPSPKSRSNTNVFIKEPEKVIHVDILLKTNGSALFDTANISDSFGCLRVNGIIASNVWLNPNVSYNAVSNAINEDIIRSLSARLGMHFDSLTEGERGFFNDAGCIHEVPRRVLLPMPDSPVSFSDYLFPGEGPQEAEMAVHDILGVKFIDKRAIADVEGQADLADYYSSMSETENEEVLPKLPADTNKLMYMVGFLVAVLILLISFLIHYFRV